MHPYWPGLEVDDADRSYESHRSQQEPGDKMSFTSSMYTLESNSHVGQVCTQFPMSEYRQFGEAKAQDRGTVAHVYRNVGYIAWVTKTQAD